MVVCPALVTVEKFSLLHLWAVWAALRQALQEVSLALLLAKQSQPVLVLCLVLNCFQDMKKLSS